MIAASKEIPLASQELIIKINYARLRAHCPDLHDQAICFGLYNRILSLGETITDSAAPSLFKLGLADPRYVWMDARIPNKGSCTMLAIPFIPADTTPPFVVDLTPVENPGETGADRITIYEQVKIMSVAEAADIVSDERVAEIIELSRELILDAFLHGPIAIPFVNNPLTLPRRRGPRTSQPALPTQQ